MPKRKLEAIFLNSMELLEKTAMPKEKNISRARRITLSVMLGIILITAFLFFFAGSFGQHAYTYSDNTKFLVYHLVSDETYGPNEYLFVRVSDFEAQLAEIKRLGYETVFADELDKTHGKKCVVITFDDGYVDNYTNVLPLLEKYDMKATVFLISDMIGADGHLSEEQILEMQESGHFHFGSHTKTHQKLYDLDKETLQTELLESRRRIEELTGKTVRALAYPNGVCDSSTELAAEEYGYEYCFTTDKPADEFYPNTRLPRSYVVRDMAITDFLSIID